MKNNILYRFFLSLALSKWRILALVFCLAITSCGLEEPYGGLKNNEGVIEFVARPIKLDKTMVTTKASEDIENNIYNAFILLFDEGGNRIMTQDVKLLDSYPSISIPADKGLSTVTACFLINVPPSFANGIIGLTNPSPGTNDNNYISTAVLSDITYSTTAPFGVPMIDHDGDSNTDSKACLPMFGMDSFEIHGEDRTCLISVKRLFAKASFNLSMDLSDNGTLGVNRNTYFELTSYQLLNLPRKARLVEPSATATTYETNWHGQENAYIAQHVRNTGNTPIYNADALGYDSQKSYSFDLYLPEYFLLPLSSTTENYGDEKYKPEMYDDENRTAIYVKLKGNYKPVSGGTVGLEYDLYLGENASTSFTLKRNKHYTNKVTITGVSDSELDCRVTITEGGDMIDVYGEVANCYAISSTGVFSFKAYKGAYKHDQLATAPKCSAGTTVEIIAQDNNGVTLQVPEGATSPFAVTDDPDTPGLKVISFNVSAINADCNMVIALKNGETTEWTWHLWFIKGLSLGNMGFFELGTQDMPDDKGKMMNMNLGATRALTGDWVAGQATGFYYKYGHRAPFFEDKLNGNGKKYHGFKSSEYLTWNTTGKSSTDPCPPGYKVPSSSVWASSKQDYMDFGTSYFTYKKRSVSIIGGLEVDVVAIDYPYSEHEANSTITSEVDTEPRPINYTLPLAVERIGMSTVLRLDPYKFTAVNYTESNGATLGKVLASDNKTLRYGKTSFSRTMDSVDYYRGEWKYNQKWWGKDWYIAWNNEPEQMSMSDFRSNWSAEYALVASYMTITGGLENLLTREDVYGIVDGAGQGYNIRCIKE